MNKPIAIPQHTILRDMQPFQGALVGNDVSGTQGALNDVAPVTVARWEECSGPPPSELDDVSDCRGPDVWHAARSDDRCLLPKVRKAYVEPEIVSRELTLQRFDPCDLQARPRDGGLSRSMALSLEVAPLAPGR